MMPLVSNASTATPVTGISRPLYLNLFRVSLAPGRDLDGWALVLQPQGLARTDVTPTAVITDHHQPYVKAVATVIPLARHVRTGLQRRCGYTTQPIEHSHVPTRDRLRGGRGLRTVRTGQRFLESFAAFPRYAGAR
jgi:hypothetical protein